MTRMVDGRVEHPHIPGQTSMLTYLEMLELSVNGYAHRPELEVGRITPPSVVLGDLVEIISVSEQISSNTGA